MPYAKKLCGTSVLIALSLCTTSLHAQAPVRDRSEAASPVDGARRAADAARDSLATAESRSSAAATRRKKADAALAGAKREVEAARQDEAAATTEILRARKADEDARAALGKLLELRK
jgi:hypothetical protein